MIDEPLLLFGGKGGVGKTTCSAAVAACLAAAHKKTLLITSDMTPSLSDIFKTTIGDRVRQVDEDLFAYEISQEAIVARWKERFSRDFSDILSQLVDMDALDSASRHTLLDYIGSAPSLREETMLDLIVHLAESGSYERIIWDTAPAGETLNLLNMPRFIKKHLTAGAKVFEGLDRIGKQLLGRRSVSDTMDEWIRVSERISRYMRDNSAFIIVANPETLVLRHVERLIGTLREYSVRIGGMVINRIEPEESTGEAEATSFRRHCLSGLRALARDQPVACVPTSRTEIRGIAALRELGKSLCGQLGLA